MSTRVLGLARFAPPKPKAPDGVVAAPVGPVITRYRYRAFFLALGFWLLFNAYSATQLLQTSIAGETGYICVSVLYGVFAVSSLIVPHLLQRVRPTIVLPIAAALYLPLIIAQIFRPGPGVIVTCGIVGVAAAALWTAQGLYIQRAAIAHSVATGVTLRDAATSLNSSFFGIFASAGGCSYILSSSLLLIAGDAIPLLFSILSCIGVVGVLCLACAAEPDSASNAPCGPPALLSLCIRRTPPPAAPSETADAPIRTGMEGGGIAALGSLNDEEEKEPTEPDVKPPTLPAPPPRPSPLFMIRFLCTDRRLLLLCPTLLATGVSMGASQALWVGQLVGQGIPNGVAWVGFVGATYSFVSALSTWLWERAILVPKFGRRGAFAVAGAIHLLFWGASALYALLVPPATPLDPGLAMPARLAFLFLSMAVYGVADAVWFSQLPATLQTFYPTGQNAVAANASMRLYTSLGFALQSSVSAILPRTPSMVAAQFAGVACIEVAAYSVLYYLHSRVCSVDSAGGESGRDGWERGSAASTRGLVPSQPAAEAGAGADVVLGEVEKVVEEAA